MIGREHEWQRLQAFVQEPSPEATLGLVWGRRRVGKSFLLQKLATETGGFYYHALRGSSGEALRELGEAIGAHTGAGAPLALHNWDHAVERLMALGQDGARVVVLDEFPYLLEHTPELESILQRHFGPGHPSRTATQTRLILCGSAIRVMSNLLNGTAPLRGRAGLTLPVAAFDFRVSRGLHDAPDLPTAVNLFAVIGGVAAYAREMCGHDLPTAAADFDRWIRQRVLSPSAPLFGEIDLLLGEDPTMARTRKANLYHATLSAVARGHHTWTSICSYVKMSGSSLTPVMDTLLSTQLIERVADPIRDNRPVYHPADSLLRFHYAVIRRHQARLASVSADTSALWQSLLPTFRSLAVGPCFEAMARHWVTHHASPESLGGTPDHVGATLITAADTGDQEIDLVIAADDHGAVPDQRTIRALGEAKVGETLTLAHLRRLERARTQLGRRATDAKLLLFGRAIDASLQAQAARRSDVELVDLERLYGGA